MDYLRRATSYRAAIRPHLHSRNVSTSNTNHTAEAGPSTPLCGTPRPGSPVDEPVQYGTVSPFPSRSLVRDRAGKMRRSMDSSSDGSEHQGAVLREEGEPMVEGSRGEGADKKLTRSRVYALIAVCTLSVGSHFAMYQLGPLKSRLHREMGTSNAQFSLLIAAYNLNSTWTPLVAGLFVAQFGTGWSSIATTTCILLGQIILLLGVLTSHIVLMTFGLFVFGLGVTPLAVVQETLVSRLAPSNHLGMSLALGLVLGKLASFVSSLVSLPLADGYGDTAPFGLSVLLCAASFAGNMARLTFGWGMDAGEGMVKEKRRFSWSGVSRLGDVFWLYILLNVFSGAIWAPFLHLSANIVKVRYGLTDGFAAVQAAILLSGALILYPVTGYITDRLSPSAPRTTFRLLLLSSCLTLSCYTYLSLPPSTFGTPLPGLISFTLGHGMSTLLLVLLVPRFLPPAYVPLGLGLHKSMEMASSAMSQTLAGVWLDHGKAVSSDAAAGEVQGGEGNGEDVGQEVAVKGLLRAWLFINVLQLLCVYGLWRFERQRRLARAAEDDDEQASSGGSKREGDGLYEAEEYERLPLNDLPPLDSSDDDSDPDDEDIRRSKMIADKYRSGSVSSSRRDLDTRSLATSADHIEASGMDDEVARRHGAETAPSSALARTDPERARSKVFLASSLAWIGLVWVVFLVDAYLDLF